jgi:hypothetical protein
MKTHAAGSNGIGPLVRQYVHERNAARKAGEAAPASQPIDTVELSAAALARFEAWKAKHAAPAEVTEPAPEPGTPETESPTTEPAPTVSILV